MQEFEDYIHKRRKSDLSHQKQCKQRNHQQNRNNQKTKMRTFQATNEISHEKTWTWLIRGSLRRETEFPTIAAQNNAIRTNYIKARIDKTQQNSKCRLCGDRNEIISHIISECSKLAQKECKIGLVWFLCLMAYQLL